MASCNVMMLLLVVLICVEFSGTVFAQASHFKPCPDKWTDHNRSCYHLTSQAVSLGDAMDTCGLDHAHLVCIEGQQENDFVKGLLDTASSSVWLGARYDRSKDKWMWIGDSDDLLQDNQNEVSFDMWTYFLPHPARDHSCSAMGRDGWWNLQNCSEKLPFLCEQRRACVAGWYGADCSSQCHCSGSLPCRQRDGLCPRGCALGWTGASCDAENPLPDATFHCLKTKSGDLQADLTVDVKSRRYRVIQAVGEEGQVLPSCSLHKVAQKANQVFITILLPAAFANVSAGNAADANLTDVDPRRDVDGAPGPDNVTDDGQGPSAGVSLPPEVTGSDDVVGVTPSRNGDSDARNAVTSSAVTTAGYTVGGDSVSVAADDVIPTAANVMVTVTGSSEQGTEAAKRDVSSDDPRNKSGSKAEDDCVANRTEDGTITWLIEFKEFPDLRTGNDITVEVTCDLEEADDLETADTISDDSEPGDPVEATMMPVTTSVYLTDYVTGQRAQHFHLGQRLRLHVDVEGLTDQECAFPHSCVIRPHGPLGSEVRILDEHGCGRKDWPVKTLTASHKGHFASNSFPAFSLTATPNLQLQCQIHVQPFADPWDCLTSCRSA